MRHDTIILMIAGVTEDLSSGYEHPRDDTAMEAAGTYRRGMRAFFDTPERKAAIALTFRYALGAIAVDRNHGTVLVETDDVDTHGYNTHEWRLDGAAVPEEVVVTYSLRTKDTIFPITTPTPEVHVKPRVSLPWLRKHDATEDEDPAPQPPLEADDSPAHYAVRRVSSDHVRRLFDWLDIETQPSEEAK
jgi:hypothetical protein